MIYSYDKNDAEKYGLRQHDVPYSDLSDLVNENTIIYDVCFVGKAKNRYEEIIKSYEYFIEKGLKCNFVISEVEEIRKKYKEQIEYKSIVITHSISDF